MKMIKCHIVNFLFTISFVVASCGKDSSSSKLDTLWALNQNEDVVVAQGKGPNAVSIYRCPSGENPQIFNEDIDLQSLESCSAKVVVYELLSFDELKETLLGITPYVVHEISDLTLAETLSNYFQEKNGTAVDRPALESRKVQLLTLGTRLGAKNKAKTQLGVPVPEEDSKEIDRIAEEMALIEMALENLDKNERQIDSIIREFWDLIQHSQVVRSRLTSLNSNIVFLGFPEGTPPPNHNLFNLWLRDLSSSQIDLERHFKPVNSSRERTTSLGEKVTINYSKPIFTSGESIVLAEELIDESRSTTRFFLTTATFKSAGTTVNFESQSIDFCIGSNWTSEITQKLMTADSFLLECFSRSEYLFVERVESAPLKVKFSKFRFDKVEKPQDIKVLGYTWVDDQWIFIVENKAQDKLIVTSLERLESQSAPIWEGPKPGLSPFPYSFEGMSIAGVHRISGKVNGLIFSSFWDEEGIGQSVYGDYFIPWPILGSHGSDLYQAIRMPNKETYLSEKKWEHKNFESLTGRASFSYKPTKENSLTKATIESIVDLIPNTENPGTLTAVTSLRTVFVDEELVIRTDRVYWRGHLLRTWGQTETISATDFFKIKRPLL